MQDQQKYCTFLVLTENRVSSVVCIFFFFRISCFECILGNYFDQGMCIYIYFTFMLYVFVAMHSDSFANNNFLCCVAHIVYIETVNHLHNIILLHHNVK